MKVPIEKEILALLDKYKDLENATDILTQVCGG